jgi:uncharacterized protein (TIGR02996 family)
VKRLARFPTHGRELRALLAACHADPDDDTPRLVLADWLQEHDDPRGELMRLQVRLAAMSAGDPEYDTLFDQHQKWWRKYQNVWLREVGTLLWDAGPHDRGLPTIGHYEESYCRLDADALGEPSRKPRDSVSALVADGWPGMTWVLPAGLREESEWDEADDFGDVFEDDEHQPARYDEEADDWDDSPPAEDPFDTFRKEPWKGSPTPIGVWFPEELIVGADHLDQVAKVPNLRGLALSEPRPSPSLLSRIAKIKGLEHLDLNDMRLDDAGLRKLAPLKNLRALIAPGAAITNAGAARLAKFAELRELRLGTRRLTAAGYQSLATLSKLEVLGLAKADDAAVRHLAPLQRLRRLDLSGPSGTTATGRGLENFPLLTHLNLEGSRADDAGLAHVAKLPRLRALKVMHTRVTGAGLAHLSDLRWLETLSLSQQKAVTDKDLVHLEGLKNLGHIDLYGTRVTTRGVNRLRKKLKGLDARR